MRTILGIGLVMCLSSVQAQNLVQNGQFDSDAAGWLLSMHSDWSNRIDFNNSETSGSLQISTGSVDDAIQCIPLRGNTTYALSIWAEKDPQSSVAPCANPAHSISLDLFDGAQCGGTNLGFYRTTSQTDPNSWQNSAGTIASPANTRSGLLTLTATCRSQSGVAIYYYDNIFVGPDAVFASDFEVHAPESGPSQPGG